MLLIKLMKPKPKVQLVINAIDFKIINETNIMTKIKMMMAKIIVNYW